MQNTVLEASLAPSQFPVPRRYPRHLFSAPITLQRMLADGPVKTHGISLEIGIGGMAATVCGPPQVGETVEIEVRSPNGQCDARAIVLYNDQTRSGFKFLHLAPALKQHIEAIDEEFVPRSLFAVK